MQQNFEGDNSRKKILNLGRNIKSFRIKEYSTSITAVKHRSIMK